MWLHVRASALLLLLLLALQVASDDCPPFDPDVTLNTPQTIRKYGYPAESHTVQTEDGYLLTMHRIPGRRSASCAGSQLVNVSSATKNSPNTIAVPTPPPPYTPSTTPSPTPSPTPPTTPPPTPRPTKKLPVLLHHGLLGSSYAWILAGPGKGLAYLLADAGYDVWLANARGNTYSRAHTFLPTDSRSPFWDFSFNEIGMYDLPAEIEYILQKTGSSQLHYIGHSMGTTAFFVLASTKPEVAAKVASSFSLAPVAFVRHIKSPIRLLAPLARDFQYLLSLLGKGELISHSKILKHLAKYGCELLPIDKTICEDTIFIICGFDAKEFDQRLLPLMISHGATGASSKNIIHYAQMVNAGKFQQFDYGPMDNIRWYNSSKPPSYDLSKVNVPVNLYYAKNDWLASEIDVNTLYNDLQCNKTKYLVPLANFNHIDFILANDVKKLLYDDIIKKLSQKEHSQIDSYYPNLI